MASTIQQHIDYKAKEVKLLKLVLKKVRQIQERKSELKDEQDLSILDKQLENI